MFTRTQVLRAVVALNLALFLVCLSPLEGVAQSNDDVKVYVTVMDAKTTADIFGRRIGDRFVAIQVTITNRSSEFQYLIHDVSLDLREIFVKCSNTPTATTLAVDSGSGDAQPQGRGAARGGGTGRRGKGADAAPAATTTGDCLSSKYSYELSSLELSLLRGVAEKGQGQDARNAILRLFRGVGTVAAGLIGVASFGPSYAESVAVFNGPLISAYMDVFPDYTINQLNRLNDAAYRSNTLIPRQQARVLVAFIPQAIFLTKKQRGQFKSDPTTLFEDIDFRRAQAVVDGNFIAELGEMPPAVTTVQFEPGELAKFQDAAPEVRGSILGRFLAGARISLLNQTPEGLSVELEGEPSDRRLNFIVKSDRPVPPGTTLNFEVVNERGVQTISRPVNYQPGRPTISAIDPAESNRGATNVAVTITGSGFIPGTTRVIPQTGSGIRVTDVRVTSATTLEATFSIAANAPLRANQIRVANGGGQSAESATFTVTAPPENPQQ